MFDVGRAYYLSFWTSAAEGITTNKVTVLEVALPLFKVRLDDGSERIINASAAAFVGAKAVDARASEARAGLLCVPVSPSQGSAAFLTSEDYTCR